MNKNIGLLRIIIRPLNNWWSYRDLLRNLVSKEIKIRYQGAALGFAWSLMNPLMITLMYLIVFTYIFPSNIPHFPLFMVVGIIHWNLFSILVMQGSDLLVGNAGLLKKIYFPRMLINFSNLLVNLILWLMALIILFILFPILGGNFSLIMLLYPIYLILFLGFIFGVALTLSILYVDFRDLKHLVEVMIQLLFWATPIVYPITSIHSNVIRDFMNISPLSVFTQIFQELLWAGVIPSMRMSLYFVSWTIVSLTIGFWLFWKRSPYLIERL